MSPPVSLKSLHDVLNYWNVSLNQLLIADWFLFLCVFSVAALWVTTLQDQPEVSADMTTDDEHSKTLYWRCTTWNHNKYCLGLFIFTLTPRLQRPVNFPVPQPRQTTLRRRSARTVKLSSKPEEVHSSSRWDSSTKAELSPSFLPPHHRETRLLIPGGF